VFFLAPPFIRRISDAVSVGHKEESFSLVRRADVRSSDDPAFNDVTTRLETTDNMIQSV
jgi:hypothetical protein